MANSFIKLEKFELDSQGVSELLNSVELSDVLMNYANTAKSDLGEGYKAVRVQSGDRKKVLVVADTKDAHDKNLKSNNMLKAVFK